MLPKNIKKYFWDVDYKKLDFKKNPEFVITRTLEYDDIKAIQWLFRTFNVEEIKKVNWRQVKDFLKKKQKKLLAKR